MKNAFFLLLSFVLFFGGLWLMYLAPSLHSWQAVTFAGGLACMVLTFAIPIHALSKPN